MLVTMKTAVISFCLLTLLSSFTNSIGLKHKAGHGGRKSVVVQNPVQRSAWSCHPGCKRFCLSSCKRSCCAPGAPNYTPDMFPQLVNYQASLPPPPPPPPSCPTGCPSTCYPNCDAGCCFPVSQPPVYPQYAPNPYDTGYAGDPCAAQSCSAACAPLCKPDCCRSQALNLSIRPVYLGSNASPATSSPPKKTAAKKKPAPPKKTKKPTVDLKKFAGKTGFLCIPPCQKLCKPVCKFECCLATYKFKDPHPAPKKPAKVHHVKPVASPQRVPVPKLLSPPEPEPEREPEPEPEPAQDTQQTPYAASYQNPNPAAAMAPLTAPTCPGGCPLSCSPSCEFSCCSPYMGQPAAPVPPQQAFPYGAVPDNPMMVVVPQGPPSPGLAPLTCPGQTCPDACAPLCSPTCCTGRSMLPATWDKRNTVPHAG